MFSVVIPLYNKELSVEQTINSVLNQSFEHFEIIVVDDGSTDSSLNVVRGISDVRLKIVEKSNGGVSSARNRGVREATYEWIAFLDGDDLWAANHLETIFRMIQTFPNENVFCTSYLKSTTKTRFAGTDSVKVISDYFEEAIKGHFFWTSIAVINRRVFDKIGLFKETLSRGEDLELWARIGRNYKFVKSNLITGIYRVEAENRSNQIYVLEKTRVYNYRFEEGGSDSEYRYYVHQIVSSLISLLIKRDFVNFFRLKKRHSNHISYLHILRRLKKK